MAGLKILYCFVHISFLKFLKYYTFFILFPIAKSKTMLYNAFSMPNKIFQINDEDFGMFIFVHSVAILNLPMREEKIYGA